MLVLILKIAERSYAACYHYLFGCTGPWVWSLDHKAAYVYQI